MYICIYIYIFANIYTYLFSIAILSFVWALKSMLTPINNISNPQWCITGHQGTGIQIRGVWVASGSLRLRRTHQQHQKLRGVGHSGWYVGVSVDNCLPWFQGLIRNF